VRTTINSNHLYTVAFNDVIAGDATKPDGMIDIAEPHNNTNPSTVHVMATPPDPLLATATNCVELSPVTAMSVTLKA